MASFLTEDKKNWKKDTKRVRALSFKDAELKCPKNQKIIGVLIQEGKL